MQSSLQQRGKPSEQGKPAEPPSRFTVEDPESLQPSYVPIEEGVPFYLHLLRWFIALLIFPVTIFAMWRTVEPKEALILTVFGKLWKCVREPGLYVFVPPVGSVKVSLRQQTVDLPKGTVADLNGNPVVVGAVVTYYVEDPIKNAFNVENSYHYIMTQASAVLKSVVSAYPYESQDGSPSLKSCSGTISAELANILREKAAHAGVVITAFNLTDLYYSQEIAAAMLMRQQAQATVDARHLIVNGAVEIVGGALEGLAKKGLTVSEGDATRLASNLLCVLCSETHVQNTLPLRDH